MHSLNMKAFPVLMAAGVVKKVGRVDEGKIIQWSFNLDHFGMNFRLDGGDTGGRSVGRSVNFLGRCRYTLQRRSPYSLTRFLPIIIIIIVMIVVVIMAAANNDTNNNTNKNDDENNNNNKNNNKITIIVHVVVLGTCAEK